MTDADTNETMDGQPSWQASIGDARAETPVADRDRHYRPPLAAGVALGFALLVLIAVDVAVIVSFGTWIAIVIAVLWTAWLAWFAVRLMRTGGVTVTSTGIRSRRLVWGYEQVGWEEIERFRAGRSRVYVVLADGFGRPLVGVAQGALTKWDGGESRDIVGELNGHLRYWRGEQAEASDGRSEGGLA